MPYVDKNGIILSISGILRLTEKEYTMYSALMAIICRQKFNGKLLKLVREASCCTQSALLERLSNVVKQSALSKYESGELLPSEEFLEKLTQWSDYPVEFFYQEDRLMESSMALHRKRKALPAMKRLRIEAKAQLLALDAFKLLRMGNIHTSLPKFDSTTSPEKVALELRSFWKLGSAPIDNMVKLLEEHGIPIIGFDFQTETIDGFVLPAVDKETFFIVINTGDAFTTDRRRFTLAHELGHAILHRNATDSKKCELEASLFAAEFLVPQKAIAPEMQRELNIKTFCELKKKWGMPVAALGRRAMDVGAIPAKKYTGLCIKLTRIGWRNREPDCGLAKETPVLIKRLLERARIALHIDGLAAWLQLGQKRCRRRYFAEEKEAVQ